MSHRSSILYSTTCFLFSAFAVLRNTPVGSTSRAKCQEQRSIKKPFCRFEVDVCKTLPFRSKLLTMNAIQSQIISMVEQNNVAAFNIKIGSYVEATALLKALLLRIKEEMNGLLLEGIHSGMKDDSLQQLVLAGLESDEQKDDTHYTYSHPVCIPFHVAASSVDEAVAVISSVVLLNLALAVHLRAVETTEKFIQEYYLQKALSLYRCVYDFNACCIPLCTIVLNNVGLIYRMLNDQEKSAACFEELLSVWMHFPTHVKGLEAIFMNAMGLYQRFGLPAAAA
eukprot:scaffold8177_cov106-Cylindrotheca_fusiformis.AAC.11